MTAMKGLHSCVTHLSASHKPNNPVRYRPIPFGAPYRRSSRPVVNGLPTKKYLLRELLSFRQSRLGSIKRVERINRYPAPGPYMGRFRIVERVLGRKLTKLPVLQEHCHSGEPPGIANPGPVFKPWAPIEGASCAP